MSARVTANAHSAREQPREQSPHTRVRRCRHPTISEHQLRGVDRLVDELNGNLRRRVRDGDGAARDRHAMERARPAHREVDGDGVGAAGHARFNGQAYASGNEHTRVRARERQQRSVAVQQLRLPPPPPPAPLSFPEHPAVPAEPPPPPPPPS